MKQSEDDIDLDDKILDSTQRVDKPEEAVANAAYDNDNLDDILDDEEPKKRDDSDDLEDHHSPRSDEAEADSLDDKKGALDTIKEVTEEGDQSERKRKERPKRKKLLNNTRQDHPRA